MSIDLVGEGRKHFKKLSVDGLLNAKTTVYMDNSAAQCIKWLGGINFLASLGVSQCHDINELQSGLHMKDTAAAIFIVDALGSNIMECVPAISRCHQDGKALTLYLSISDECILSTSILHDKLGSYIQIENALNHTIRSGSRITVQYFPLHYLSLLRGGGDSISTFVLSPYLLSNVYPSANIVEGSIGADERGKDGAGNDHDNSSIPKYLTPSQKYSYSLCSHMLAHTIHTLGLNVEGSAFALGYASTLIGNKMMDILKGITRRETEGGPRGKDATIIIIDRTVDLVAPMKHGENLLDRLFDVLPRSTAAIDIDLPSHNAIHSGTYSDTRGRGDEGGGVSFTSINKEWICGCSLSHPNDPTVQGVIASIATKKEAAALAEVNGALLEAEMEEEIDEDTVVPGIVLATNGGPVMRQIRESFNRLSTHKGGMTGLKYIELLQVVAAVIAAFDLGDPSQSPYDELYNIEAMSRNSCSSKESNLILPLIDVLSVKRRGSGAPLLKIKDVLKLAIYSYSLGGMDPGMDLENIDTLSEALTTALLTCDEQHLTELKMFDSQMIKSMVAAVRGGESDEVATVRVVLNDIVQDIMQKLDQIAASRIHLKQFPSVIHDAKYTSVVSQLLRAVYDPAGRERKEELPDLVQLGSVMQQFVGGFFSSFMNVAKPRPGDRSTVVIFFVGGLTGSEVGDIRDMKAHLSAKGEKVNFIVGSNTFASAEYIYNKTFT